MKRQYLPVFRHQCNIQSLFNPCSGYHPVNQYIYHIKQRFAQAQMQGIVNNKTKTALK